MANPVCARKIVASKDQGVFLALSSGLEQLDWISVGIFDLYLLAAWTDLHLIAETNACFRERRDERREVLDAQDHAVPSARFLRPPVGHRA